MSMLISAATSKKRLANQRYQLTEKGRRAERNKTLKRKYGIGVAQYEQLLEAQGGVCAICHKPEETLFHGKPRRLAVDHDHATNRVRGLLCHNCNRAIGLMRDDSERLAQAAVYLKVQRGIP